ncbi:MAG TPA: DUF2007 domain-containing protein [Actinomycetota bacterium]|nr:DUF2007 domain-containing protein [Actinomycetota bacterium]
MDWTKLASLTNIYEADLLAGRLQEAGIGSQTIKSANAPGAWLTGSENSFGPIDLYVPADRLDAARKLLPAATAPSDRAAERSPRSKMRIVGAVVVTLSLVAGAVAAVTDALN